MFRCCFLWGIVWSLAAATEGVGAAATDAALDARFAQILSQVDGRTAAALTELVDGQPKLIAGVNADERLAVGSSFKLFILGQLIDEVNADRRQADNVMRLRADLEGPPASELSDWPVGSPVTLHTLALKMISISDNTATDHLLHLLGREEVERRMAAMGHSDPAVNRPLLSTREMTLLRDKGRGLPGRAYQRLDEAARRRELARLDAETPDYDRLDFDTAAYPLAEWYASPLDMARALGWIEAHARPEAPAHELLAILTVETKLEYDRQQWPYVGFKGGSEDQLIAGNWLLRNRNGKWYTLHLYCNNPTGRADPQQIVAAAQSLLTAAEEMIEREGK